MQRQDSITHNRRATPSPSPWRQELNDLVRGLAGGFLFGIPLLYTMEAWWIGTHAEPWRLLLMVLFALAVNWMLSHFSGFHQGKQVAHPFTDAVEALGLGIIGAALTLVVLGEINPQRPFNTIVGMIALESVPFSLGVSIANGFLSGTKEQPGNDNRQSGEQQGIAAERPSAFHGTMLDAGATVAGALFISFSIAPTEEVPMLSVNLGTWGIIVLVVFSLIVSYMITFEAGFADQEARHRQEGVFQRPMTETIFSYLLSLIVAAILLSLFKQLAFADPWYVWVSRTIILGLPAAIGGSAGRLAVGG